MYCVGTYAFPISFAIPADLLQGANAVSTFTVSLASEGKAASCYYYY